MIRCAISDNSLARALLLNADCEELASQAAHIFIELSQSFNKLLTIEEGGIKTICNASGYRELQYLFHQNSKLSVLDKLKNFMIKQKFDRIQELPMKVDLGNSRTVNIYSQINQNNQEIMLRILIDR